MPDGGFAEMSPRPIPESTFSPLKELQEPLGSVFLGPTSDESTHAELQVLEGYLYLAQPDPTTPDMHSDASWNVLYCDRSTNRWILSPLTDQVPEEQDGKVLLKVKDIPHPDDETIKLQPMVLLHFDSQSETFRLMPKMITGDWNGSGYDSRVPDMCIQTEDQVLDFTNQAPPESWSPYQKPKEIPRDERKATIRSLKEEGSNLAKLLNGLNEMSEQDLPESRRTEVKYNATTGQWITHICMRSAGVEKLLNTALDYETDELGQEFGFGSRMVFMKDEVISTAEGAKTIRGSIYKLEYNEAKHDFDSVKILPGVDIVGRPTAKRTRWTMACSAENPQDLSDALHGLTRSVRARK